MPPRRFLLAVLALVGAFVLVDGFLYEPWKLNSPRIELPCRGLRGGEIRVLLFSDVDFHGEGPRERRLRSIARDFQPHLVLVAGDFLDRGRLLRRPETQIAAAAFIESLPASAGRFLVPGEEEAAGLEILRRAWRGRGVEVLANDARTITVHGDRVDVFGALPPSDGLPWSLERGPGGRPFVTSRERRPLPSDGLVYSGGAADAPAGIEATFAFMALGRSSYIDFRFAWTPGAEPAHGEGWRLTRHEDKPDVRLYVRSDDRRSPAGTTRSGFVPPSGQWCRARVRLENGASESRVRARFWRESEGEPDTWSIDAWDASPGRFRKGTVGFGGRAGDRRYADLRVTDLAGGLLLEERFDDDQGFRRRWSTGSALDRWLSADRPAGTPTILLAHSPDAAVDAADLGGRPSLVLAGHTHGGQVRIPGFGSLWPPTRIGRRYSRGLAEYRGIPVYVTPGVGTGAIPIRVFSRPEVTRIVLNPAYD